jgi:hypothetical protein
MAQIGRTHRSVEFKHQSISAVLGELGLPWIPGYKPKRNYQNAIFDAIDRYLSGHSAVLERLPASRGATGAVSAVFVDAPAAVAAAEPKFPIGCAALFGNSTRWNGTIATVGWEGQASPLWLSLNGSD